MQYNSNWIVLLHTDLIFDIPISQQVMSHVVSSSQISKKKTTELDSCNTAFNECFY